MSEPIKHPSLVKQERERRIGRALGYAVAVVIGGMLALIVAGVLWRIVRWAWGF